MTSVVAPAVDLGCVAAYGLCGPRLMQRVPPAMATWLLTVLSAVAAVAGVMVLTLLALPLIGQSDALADRAHWSAAVLAKDSPVGRGVAAAAVAVLLAVLVRTGAELWRQCRAYRAAGRFATSLGGTAGGLIVTRDRHADVFALGGRARVIVATAGLMQSLPAPERRAVLAHERSHLRHRHHLHLAVTSLAATLNPLLWQVPSTARYLVERWADEDSARETSRRLTAGALAQLAGDGTRRPLGALHAAATAVARRIAALEAAPHRVRPLFVVPPGVLVIAAAVAAVVATDHVYDVFRLALAAGHHVLSHHH